MADNIINATTYEQIVELLGRLHTDYSNMASVFYDVFYNKEPKNVTFQMYNGSNELTDYTVKNLALSNEYRVTGEGEPKERLEKGTIYQDLVSGDLYIKKTDSTSSQGWEKFLDSGVINSYILHGKGNPDGKISAGIGTLYTDTTSGSVYTCIGGTGWTLVSVTSVDFLNRDLSNLDTTGEEYLTQYIGDTVKNSEFLTQSIGDSSQQDEVPSAAAIYNFFQVGILDSKQDVSNLAQTLEVESPSIMYPSVQCIIDNKQDIDNIIQEIKEKVDHTKETVQKLTTITDGNVNVNNDTVIYYQNITADTTFNFNIDNVDVEANNAITFELMLNMQEAHSLVFNNILWQNDDTPDMSEPGFYLFAFRTVDMGNTWLGNIQGIWNFKVEPEPNRYGWYNKQYGILYTASATPVTGAKTYDADNNEQPFMVVSYDSTNNTIEVD